MIQKRTPSKLFWICLLIPLLVLVSMLIKPVSTKMYGEEVVLATIPIDPRDLFYGDYVLLDLEIEEIDAKLIEPSLLEKLEKGEFYGEIPVYVSLRKGEGGIYEAASLSKQKPKDLFIKGKMSPYFEENSLHIKSVRVDYGIDRFYVEEGTGLKLEEQARKGKVLVSVKIRNGYPVITEIKGE
ncbi:MAG TPA: GDYXXLXY domain-containing protein [Pseudoneobacillus sp.]|nr:GDYXXLXY domain-containing protein [Pseudoneobacillus sp.]